MITPILERLLLEQKAIYKTHNHGVGGVGTIFNPDNRTIIVTDITYHPFIDGDSSFSNTPQGLNGFLLNSRFIHTLKLQAKENICNWTFKDNFKLTNIREAGIGIDGKITDLIIVTPDAPVKHDCFFIANEDIHINIKALDGIIAHNDSPMEPQSKEEKVPLGYGTVNDLQNLTTVKLAVLEDDFSNQFSYFPAGDRDVINYALPFPKMTQFNMLYKLKVPVLAYQKSGVNSFPVITFGYVELNSKYKISDIIPKH